jgi:signal transduction histidine kinase
MRWIENRVAPFTWDENGHLTEVIGLARDITKRKQAEAEMEQLFQEVSRQRKRLRALTQQLAEAQEVERKALAKELHDRVGQNLSGLGLNLNLIRARLAETPLEAGPIQIRLDDSLALLSQITERIRDVMANLRPPVLDDYGLLAALHWYGSQVAERTGLTVAVEGQEPLPRLAAAVENTLFRIAQEALTNVAKHARAGEVAVTLEMDNGTVRLVIGDDGCGFDLTCLADSAGSHGWGVPIMVERAEAVGGWFRIESSPGQGTQVIVEVTPSAIP